jgi:AraC family carnitine catabolism transcriptional activator
MFGFLLVPRFSMMAFVSALEPLRVANRLAQDTLYAWEIISRDGAAVTASNDLSILAHRAMGAPARYDRLVVVASFAPETACDRATASWLRRLDRDGVALGSIDTGSFVLAAAGLLDGHRATTHWESLDGFTCAGGTAALDMMLHLIRLRHGPALASSASEQFIHAKIRDPQERQRMDAEQRDGISRPALAQAIALMETHLEEVLGIGQICATAGISRRNLERLFQRHFRLSPQRYYLDLRLQRARAMLLYSDLPVVEISVACGFGAAAHFSRAYRAWAGHPPSVDRRATAPGITPHPR